VLRIAPAIGFLYAVELTLGLVLSVLLHEFGHALAAKRYRLTGLSIMLHGFGGFAVSRGYRNPKQQVVIVLAGPAVTFILAAIGYGAGVLRDSPDLSREAQIQLSIAYILGITNLMMGILNMIPLLPFDGGQASAALLNFKMPEIKAKRLVAHIGMILAPILIIAGLTVLSGLVAVFGLIGVLTCYRFLADTGGNRFKEFFDDRKEAKAVRASKKREAERKTIYIDEVVARQVKRDEDERLKKLFEDGEGK
jgi:Zn-dependent protease